jgi:hypothetical protein
MKPKKSLAPRVLTASGFLLTFLLLGAAVMLLQAGAVAHAMFTSLGAAVGIVFCLRLCDKGV